MTKFYILIIGFITFLMAPVFSQTPTVSEVVPVDKNLTKAALYSNALTWFAKTFKSANSVIQMKDIDSGKVIGKGIVDDRNITIDITCKDGKYKYEITFSAKTDMFVPITFKVNHLGAMEGPTTGDLVWIEGKPAIKNIVFTSTGFFGHGGKIYFDNPGPSYNQDWIDSVKKETDDIYKIYIALSDPNAAINAEILKSLIEGLKSEMLKSPDF